MLSIVGNKSNSLNKESTMSAVSLRAFRNKFFKYYIKAHGELRSEDLSALLLYFALSFIENNSCLAKLFSTAASINKKLNEFTDNELVLLSNEFLGLLYEFLPEDLMKVMVVPDKVSWDRACQFFKKQSDDLIFSDMANLGFAYQIFSSSDRKEKALPALQKANKKISKKELIAFTQLYTPNWVVDFLIANTVLGEYESDKISHRYADWALPSQNKIRKINTMVLKDFSLIDPACGAGQFIFSAFDLLSELYELNGYSRGEAAKLILSKNIFAADIDEKALWVVALGLLSKYLIVCDSIASMPERLSNLALISVDDVDVKINEDDFLGSIDNRLPTNHFLKNEYSVIVTNPPYIGRRCLSREIKKVLKQQYPNSSADLSAAFLERCLSMLTADGRLGVITQSSVMSIPSCKALRNYLLENYYLQSVIQCGPGVFPLTSGEKVDSVLLVVNGKDMVAKQKFEQKTCFIDLNNIKDKAVVLRTALNNESDGKLDGSNLIFIDQSDLAYSTPNNLPLQLSANFFKKINELPKLVDIADIRQGLATTDNGRFVRYHFDVEEKLIGKTWVHYIKGAGAERYASNNPFVVKWENNGREIKEAVASAYPYLKGKTAWVVKNEEFYFRPGLCFSFINKSGLAVRRLPAGAIFDVASSAIFTSPEEEDFLLAYLNSRVIGFLAKCINQTINIQVGDLKKIPIIPLAKNLKEEISKLGKLAFETKKSLLDFSFNFFKSNSEELSANDLSAMLAEYIKIQLKLQEELCRTQADIDRRVMDAMENSGFISSIERSVLDVNLSLSKKQVLTERQGAYKMLNAMVSNMVSGATGDRIVLVPFVNKESLSGLFNLNKDGTEWFENRLEAPLEKIIMQARIVDISKLAQEPSRYFSFYLQDRNACMLFSSAAARRLKNDTTVSNIFIANEEIADLDLLKKVNLFWDNIFTRLDTIVDWTSKDLFTAFKAIVF